ncbi:hypothetical protein CASFOL_019547 [Castilleja foliolosa]|uniref:Uncharacterized protein n=1 Tax=Castilleja foliolosa TaxID=1961234 RepID=A0ABD3D5B5_9LAMI
MQRYCFFNIHSEDSYETCGTRRGITDVAGLFIIRYERNNKNESLDTTKEANNILHAWYHTDYDPVSTLVAKYNGSSDTSEIIRWISQIIKDGDTREIPPFANPELVPEDAGQIWSHSSKKFVSTGKNMKQLASSFISLLSDYLGDPRIGPSLCLVALTSSGLVYLNKSRSTKSTIQNESNQLKLKCPVNPSTPGELSGESSMIALNISTLSGASRDGTPILPSPEHSIPSKEYPFSSLNKKLYMPVYCPQKLGLELESVSVSDETNPAMSFVKVPPLEHKILAGGWLNHCC